MQACACLWFEAMAEQPGAAELFKALSDPTRRVILDELVERDEQTLFELCSRLASKQGKSHDVVDIR